MCVPCVRPAIPSVCNFISSRRNHNWREFSTLQFNPSIDGGQEKKNLGWDCLILLEIPCVWDCCPSLLSWIGPTMENMELWALCGRLNWYWQLGDGGGRLLFLQPPRQPHAIKRKQIYSTPMWVLSPLTINKKLEKKSIPIWAPSRTHVRPPSPIKKCLSLRRIPLAELQ